MRASTTLGCFGCLALVFATGCGETAPVGNAPPDAGAVTDAGGAGDGASTGTRDSAASAPDSGTTSADSGPSDDASGPPFPDGGTLPNGKQIVPSDVVTLDGLTSDGYAIYTDTSAGKLYAVSVAGGSPVSLGTATVNTNVAVIGAVTFIWNVIGKYSDSGPLSIWTSAYGLKSLASRSYLFPVVSASGSRVLYLDNVVFTGSYPGDVYVANTDGTGKTKLASQVPLDTVFNMAFAGETALVSGVFSGDVDATAGTLEAFAAPTWTPTTIATDVVGAFVTNPANTAALALTASGLAVYPLAGGQPVVIDPNGVAGMFTSDGSAVVYTSMATALLRSPSTAGQPTMLVASGFPSLVGLSPGDAWALGTVPPTQLLGPGQGQNLYLASATSVGSAQTLSMTANLASYTSSTPLGTGSPVFTADASHVLFESDPTLTGLTTLHVSLPNGASGQTFGGVWAFQPTTAGQVVFDDHYVPTGGVGSNGSADVEWLDTTKATPPTVLVSQADANFYVTADMKTLVYSWSYLKGSSGGVWTLPLP